MLAGQRIRLPMGHLGWCAGGLSACPEGSVGWDGHSRHRLHLGIGTLALVSEDPRARLSLWKTTFLVPSPRRAIPVW